MLEHQPHCVLVCAHVLTLSGSNCFFTCLLDWYIFLPSGVIVSTNEKNIIDLKTYTQWSYCPCILILNLFNYILHIINSLLPSRLTHQLSLCTDSLAIHRHIQQPVLEGWEEDQYTTINTCLSLVVCCSTIPSTTGMRVKAEIREPVPLLLDILALRGRGDIKV